MDSNPPNNNNSSPNIPSDQAPSTPQQQAVPASSLACDDGDGDADFQSAKDSQEADKAEQQIGVIGPGQADPVGTSLVDENF